MPSLPPMPLGTRATAARQRTELLDALRLQLDERPWGEVTMADVATAAGVSRQTLYREFGSRRELGAALVLREADRFLADVEAAMRGRAGDATGALADAFDAFLALAAGNPIVAAFLSPSGAEELLPSITVEGGPLLTGAVQRLARTFREGHPALPEEDAVLVAECLVRLALSHLATPEGPAAMTGASLAALLGPRLQQLTA